MSQGQTLASKLGFLLGWLFFALAFLFAAAESSVERGLITSANDVLLAINPGTWIATKARLASPLFDMLVLPLLELPGWLLAGLPAGFLLWTCRPHRETVDPELYESLTAYDRLAEMAEEEGAENDDPTFAEFNMDDYDDDHAPDDLKSLKSYMEEWQPDHPEEPVEPTSPVKPMGPDEKMQHARDNLSIPFDKLS